MTSPTGIIPEELMFPAKLGEVMDYLKSLPVPGETKAQLFSGWARAVGVKVSGSQFAAVRNTGTDR